MKYIVMIVCLALASCSTAEAKTKHKGSMMVATWYQCCHRTASGARFDPEANTVAHRKLPFGTKLRLTYPKSGKSLVAIVNDRGPFIKGKQLDVTRGVARRLGFIGRGTASLIVEIIK